ncbi:LEA type 2 family protein [bacterium]|nr:LEA type 2 family protein [bacterium]
MRRCLLLSASWVLVAGVVGCGGTGSFLGSGAVKPEITAIHPRITGIDLGGVNLAFDVDVANPYAVPIRSPRFRYSLDVSGSRFLASEQTVNVDLPKRGTGTVTLPLRMGYGDLWRTYENLKEAREIAYELRGALILPVSRRNVEVPFTRSGNFPVLRLPSFSDIDAKVLELGMGTGQLAVKANLTNPNVFALGLKNLGYAIKIGDIQLSDLSASTLGNVGPGETQALNLNGRLTGGNLARILSGGQIGRLRIEPTGFLETPYGQVPLSR